MEDTESQGKSRAADPVPDEGQEIPSPEAATQGYKPLEAELRSEQKNLFPPDVDPTVELGGSPEERQILEEELTP